jgi:hypothetical protein
VHTELTAGQIGIGGHRPRTGDPIAAGHIFASLSRPLPHGHLLHPIKTGTMPRSSAYCS